MEKALKINNCTVTEHIEEISRKGNRRLDIIRHYQKTLDRKTLSKLYISYVRPILEYSASVWSNCTKAEETTLEEIQLKAIRIITGAKKGTSHESLYKEVGWPTLDSRRTYQNLTFLHKIIHNVAPPGLTDLLPGTRGERNPYNVRVSRDLDIPKARTEAYYTSFMPDTCRIWNNLPEELKQTDLTKLFTNFIV